MGGKKFWRICLLGTALLFATIGIIYLCTPKEPRYQDRTLSDWLADSHEPWQPQPTRIWRITGPTPNMRAAAGAIKAIGTNAIPILLKWLQAKDSPAKIKLNLLLDRQNFIRFRFQSVQDQNLKADQGFRILGWEGHAAIPELIHLTRSPDAELCERALTCLILVKPEKNVLLPVLVQLLNDPSREVHGYAAYCVEANYPEEMAKDRVLRDLVMEVIRNTRWAKSLTNQPAAK
jgi:hypothetical protein